MESTIDVLKTVEMSGVPTSTCLMGNGNLAVGDDNGKVSIFNIEGELIQSYTIDGKVIGLLYLDGDLIAGSSISGITQFSKHKSWHHKLNSGCEMLSISGSEFLVSDSSGALYRFSFLGELLWKKEYGQITHISSNNNGDFSCMGLEDGRVVILNQNGEIIQESLAAKDDIETISCMLFRPDDILVVARNSLGLVIDERPENRIECWSMTRGLIHTSEVESLVTSMCSTSNGVILGCFDGNILNLEVTSIIQENLVKFDYPITKISTWNNDLLIASWFDIFRVNFDKELTWSLEHTGIVEHIIKLDDSRVAILGDDKKQRTPSPMYIINPDSEVKTNEYSFNDTSDDVNFSNEFSGALSEDEEKASFQRPELPEDTSEIFDALDEELEIIVTAPIVEADLLENLSKSAKSINLPPIVDVGEDKTISSNDEGTAIVLLDGSKSYDPDGFIKTWSWENGHGKVISNKSKVQVKLSKGVHVFYLTISDDRDAYSKATLTIQII